MGEHVNWLEKFVHAQKLCLTSAPTVCKSGFPVVEWVSGTSEQDGLENVFLCKGNTLKKLQPSSQVPVDQPWVQKQEGHIGVVLCSEDLPSWVITGAQTFPLLIPPLPAPVVALFHLLPTQFCSICSSAISELVPLTCFI